MKVAVVTPYYQEPIDKLLRCHSSVAIQSHLCTHYMVADGHPQETIDSWPTVHIKIPPAADCGNTPRVVGFLAAKADGADAIALLDADCWFENDHIERMVARMQETGAHVVTCPRTLHRLNNTKMGVDTESEGNNWNDTNCFLIRREAFEVFTAWIGEKKNAYIQDRIFWNTIKSGGWKIERMPAATVNYETTIAAHYLERGETPPPEAKHIMMVGNEWKRVLHSELPQIKFEAHALAWPNVDQRMLKAHSDVMKHLNIPVKYTIEQIPHGQWMDQVMSNSKADVIAFFDIDCVPTNSAILKNAVDHVFENQNFVGIAQASNHIPPKSHIFAAPAFFVIYRKIWEKINKPTFSETPQADVAENVCYAAELAGVRYKTLFPTHYTRPPLEGIWHLHTYGQYGIGTHFEGGVFHLYQGRYPDNVDLFVKTCQNIIQGQFTTEGMKPCR